MTARPGAKPITVSRGAVLDEHAPASALASGRLGSATLDGDSDGLQPTIPHLTRSSLHRCLERHGISRPEIDGDRLEKRRFASDAIGDVAEVSTAAGKLRLFVAIDRTVKFAVARLVESAGTTEAARLPHATSSRWCRTTSMPC